MGQNIRALFRPRVYCGKYKDVKISFIFSQFVEFN